MLPEQSCRNTAGPAGRTAGLQEDGINRLASGDGTDLDCPMNIGSAHIGTAFCHHPGLAGEDVLSVAADDIGGFPRGWETTKLFRTDRDPDRLLEQTEAGLICLYNAVIACAQSDKAGADQVEGPRLIRHCQN